MPEPTPASSPTQLAPPADLELVPPQPVAAVSRESAAGRIKLTSQATAELDGQVRSFIDSVTALDEHDPKFKECVDRIHSMGNKEVEQAASVSNRMLERPVRTMKNGL